VKIFTALLDNTLYLIAGSAMEQIEHGDAKVKLIKVSNGSSRLKVGRILQYLVTQCKIALRIFFLLKKVDTWFFLVEGEMLILPVIVAKLLQKKVILVLPNSVIGEAALKNTPYFPIISCLTKINRALSDKIIVYSPILISTWELGEFRHKIIVAHKHYVDISKFTIINGLKDTPKLVGYIGRLSEEKGIFNFIQAIPMILKEQQDVHIFIAGDGAQIEKILEPLQEKGITDQVTFSNWISHDKLPKYLNQLQLFVLPSYTEGLPNIMIEAMACGTPVLATPVGAIPDVIKEGETGFILENNSPECIAESVIKALNSNELNRIAKRSRQVVEENFTFDKCIETWKKVFKEIG